MHTHAHATDTHAGMHMDPGANDKDVQGSNGLVHLQLMCLFLCVYKVYKNSKKCSSWGRFIASFVKPTVLNTKTFNLQLYSTKKKTPNLHI